MAGDVLIEKLTAELGADAAQMIAAFVATERAAENAARALDEASRKAERDVTKAARAAEREATKATRAAEREAKKAADAAKRHAKEVEDSFTKSYTEINAKLQIANDIAGKFFGTLRSGAAIMAAFVQNAIAYANSVERAANNTGLAVEQVQALQFALKDAGIENATKGIEFYSRVVGTAFSQPTGEAAKTLKDLGIGLFDAEGKARDFGSILFDTVDLISKLGNEQKQASVTSRLFGEESGRGLAREFAKGTGAIREQMEAARAHGLILDSQTIAAIRRMEDAWARLKAQGDSLSREVLKPFIPILEQVAIVTEGWLQQLRPLSTMIGRELSGSFNGWFRLLQKFVDFVDKHPVLASAIPIIGPSIVGIKRDLDAARAELAKEAAGLAPVPLEIERGSVGPAPETADPTAAKQAADFLKRLREENELFGVQSFERLRILEQRDLAAFGATEEAKAAIQQKWANEREKLSVEEAEARIKATQDAIEIEERRQKTLEDLADKEAADIQRIAEEKARIAKTESEEQERQVQNLLRSYETLAEGRAREIEKIRELAMVSVEVRGMEQELIDRVNAKFDEMEKRAKGAVKNIADESTKASKQMRTAFVDFLIDPVNKGFDGLAEGWINSLKRMAAEQLASGLFGGFGRGPVPVRRAGGGPISGPGTSRSDSIPALLSNGEFVLNAESVRLTNLMFGPEFLHRWNQLGPPRPQAPRVSSALPRRFADGGLVIGSPPAQAGEAAQLNLAIVNVRDKQEMFAALASKQGADIVFNHMGADPHRAKLALGLKG